MAYIKFKFAPDKRKRPLMKGTELSYPAGVAQRYREKLERLVARMTEETMRRFLRLFKSKKAKEAMALDWSLASQARVLGDWLAKKYKKLFDDEGWKLSEKLVEEASDVSAAAVSSSLKKLSGGLTINTDFTTAGMKEIASASVAENVSLIKSIADKYLQQVQGDVMRSITSGGGGVGELTKSLEKYEGMTKRRARNIAEDQTRKVYTSINSKRLQKAGIDKFMWKYNYVGQDSRELHIKLDGQVFSFSDPPVIQDEPRVVGLPGDLPYCHCSATPVIEFEDDNEEV